MPLTKVFIGTLDFQVAGEICVLNDCGGRSDRSGEKRKKSLNSLQSLWLNVFRFSLCIKNETGEVNQWHVTEHHCFKASLTLNLHFHVIIFLPFHCELLEKMTSNICSTLAIIEMPAIIHYRSSYSAFYLPWLCFNGRPLWRSEHVSVCFKGIYWDCSKLLCMAGRLVIDEWCFSLQFGKTPWRIKSLDRLFCHAAIDRFYLCPVIQLPRE